MSTAEISIEEYQRHPSDTGSSEVQIARLTERIRHLTDHMKSHRKDFSTQRGLLRLVGKRRRLLDYLKREDVNRYQAVIEALGLRR